MDLTCCKSTTSNELYFQIFYLCCCDYKSLRRLENQYDNYILCETAIWRPAPNYQYQQSFLLWYQQKLSILFQINLHWNWNEINLFFITNNADITRLWYIDVLFRYNLIKHLYHSEVAPDGMNLSSPCVREVTGLPEPSFISDHCTSGLPTNVVVKFKCATWWAKRRDSFVSVIPQRSTWIYAPISIK